MERSVPICNSICTFSCNTYYLRDLVQITASFYLLDSI